MKTINYAGGLRVSVPDGIEVSAAAPNEKPQESRKPPILGKGAVPMPATTAPATGDDVVAALEAQDMELVAAIHIQPTGAKPGVARSGLAPTSAEVTVDLDLGMDEGAVVLLEQEGMYAWQFESKETMASPATGGMRREGRAAGRHVTFSIPLGKAKSGASQKRGWITDFIVGPAVAFIFKYAGRFLLGRGMAFLERKVRTGLVLMDKDDPAQWSPAPDFSTLKLPADRPARILLFVHGTFSSTIGGFAQLGVTPWGQEFLKAVRANYDAVVGFDHPTLSVDPLVNANAILRSLEARQWTQPVTIDAISHSRGGITLRSLIEYLLPAATIPARVERAVFVGAVNGGTELAEPENWRTFINFYTNIAVGAARAISVFPQAALVATLTSEILKSVGILAKVLAEEVITNQAVPGLAAMQPSGPFITELNKTQKGQLSAADSRYYAITSDFKAKLALGSLKELPQKFLLAFSDGAADKFMKVANDLVVNTDSMTRVDPHVGNFMKDTLAFGTNGVVYHTNYFLQPQVVNALTRWLELASPAMASPARSGAGGGTVRVEVPARMDIDILVVSVDRAAADVKKRILERSPSYVVAERFWKGERLHYAFQAEEALERIAQNPHSNLQEALGVHEFEASREGPADNLPSPLAGAPEPSLRRVVAMDQGRVVGVAEAGVAPTSLVELAAQAKSLQSSGGAGEMFTRRRIMPSYINEGLKSPKVVPTFVAEPPVRRGHGSRRGPVAPGGPRMVPLPPPTPLAPPPPSNKAKCHFLAEMNDEVLLDEGTTVDVTVSRELIQAVRASAASGVAAVNVGEKIILEVIPKKNFNTVGPDRVEIDIPTPGEPVQVCFEVQGTNVDKGELIIRARQGMRTLVNLHLHCQIVSKRTRPAHRTSDPKTAECLPGGPEPLHQLTIFEVERGQKTQYHFILDSPSLGLKHTYLSNPLEGNVEAFIKGIYKDIEEKYLNDPKDFKRFQKELRRIGADLWDEIFPDDLKAALWKFRDKIKSILVFSEEPFIPWELVHLKEPGQGIPTETRFFGQMGLVRWLHNTGWPPVDLRARPGRCKYVIPVYPHPEYKLPGAEEEKEFLEKEFEATETPADTEAVEALLETPGAFDMLHFACHGAAESDDIRHACLLLTGRVDEQDYILEKMEESVIEQLTTLVGPDGVKPIVTLNACQAGRTGKKLTRMGGFPRAFLRQGAGMLIAALWSVGDQPARTFTEKLYKELLGKSTLADATIAARAAASNANEATWLAYAVYGNPHAQLNR